MGKWNSGEPGSRSDQLIHLVSELMKVGVFGGGQWVSFLLLHSLSAEKSLLVGPDNPHSVLVIGFIFSSSCSPSSSFLSSFSEKTDR